RRRPRVRARDFELHLPGLASDPRVGDRARPDRVPAPVPVATVDLFARCRRRRIPIAPALRALRSRLGFWAWVVVLFELFGLLGAWPDGAPRPVSPRSEAATNWPLGMLFLLGLLAIAGWFVTRERLLPRYEVTVEEELAGHAAALLAL